MTTDAQPLTIRGVLETSETILHELRDVIDGLFAVFEAADKALAAGRYEDAHAQIRGVLEAAPDFRAKSAVRTLLSDCKGNA